MSLNRGNRPVGVRHRLTLRRLAHKPLTLLSESHYRRRRPHSLRIYDDRRLSSLDHRYTAVRSSQINSNYLAHFTVSCYKALFDLSDTPKE